MPETGARSAQTEFLLDLVAIGTPTSVENAGRPETLAPQIDAGSANKRDRHRNSGIGALEKKVERSSRMSVRHRGAAAYLRISGDTAIAGKRHYGADVAPLARMGGETIQPVAGDFDVAAEHHDVASGMQRERLVDRSGEPVVGRPLQQRQPAAIALAAQPVHELGLGGSVIDHNDLERRLLRRRPHALDAPL